MRNRRVRCLSARYPSPCLLSPPHSSFTLCLCPSHFLRFNLETSSAALQVDDNMERENNNNINNKERRRNGGCRKEWEREGDRKQGEEFMREGTKGGRKEDGGMEDGNRQGKEGEKDGRNKRRD